MNINDYQNLVNKSNDGCNIGRLKAACQLDTPDNENIQTARIPVADLYSSILSLQSNVGDLSDFIKRLTFDGSYECQKEIATENIWPILYHLTEIANALNISLNDVIDKNLEYLTLFNSETDSYINDCTINDKEQPEYHCGDCVNYDDKHLSCLCDDAPHSKVYICNPDDDVCECFDLD